MRCELSDQCVALHLIEEKTCSENGRPCSLPCCLPQCWLYPQSRLRESGRAAQQEAQRQVTQPYNNAPLWREVRSGSIDGNTTTQVRGRETNVLINAQGEDWRQFRNGPVSLIGGAVIVAVALLIWAFYRWRGEIKFSEPPTGRLIQRFTEWERLNHWTVAISFVVLGTSGLIMFFGKHLLLPVLGYSLFSWLEKIAITLHNFVGPVFFVGIIALFFTFVKKNGWRRYDFTWLKKGGGLLPGEHVSSGFFNAGEKLWFWGGLTFLGLIVSCSGFVLDFANFGQTRNTMQLANMVHGIGALLFVAGSFGHIYIGTIGMEGPTRPCAKVWWTKAGPRAPRPLV